MAGSVNKVIIIGPDPSEMYVAGASIPQVSAATGIAISTLRFRFKREGILRSRSDAIRLAAGDGRLGSGLRGKHRDFSPSHCSAISRARLVWGEEHAAGVSLKPSGYVEFTRGPHKGKSVHQVKMEERLGRLLSNDECVHHIDGIKTNNEDNNLALVTRSGHARLHRREQSLSKKSKE